MAKYSINYACGHDEMVQLYGPHKDRESKIEWMERGVCPECWRKKRDEARAKETLAAAETAKASGLPELIGTEKQIAWAETIRKNLLAEDGNYLKPNSGEIIESQPEEKRPLLRAMVEAGKMARSRLETEASAHWWIENREARMYVIDAMKTVEKQYTTGGRGMRTVSYTEIEHAEKTDIGKIAIISADRWGNTLAIEPDINACYETMKKCGMERMIDGEPQPLTLGDLQGDDPTIEAVLID